MSFGDLGQDPPRWLGGVVMADRTEQDRRGEASGL
jgi:hypothetical protein